MKANIHWPAAWVLLRDAVQTLMSSVELIPREGLRRRMEEPKKFLTRINRLCIEMGHGRRQAGSAKKRKTVLRQMKRLVKIVRGHAASHRRRLDQEWSRTGLTRRQAEQIPQRIDAVLTQLPAAVKQAHERIIGERPVRSADKILSFNEPDVHVIVRGKAGAEVEFGNTLVSGEADDGLINCWKPIRGQAQADCHQVEPSLSRVQDIFPDRVKGIVNDRGCDSKDNAESLAFVGIKNGLCPKNPREMKRRFQEAEFAAWQKRRAQTESRIAIFKREFLGQPCAVEVLRTAKSWSPGPSWSTTSGCSPADPEPATLWLRPLSGTVSIAPPGATDELSSPHPQKTRKQAASRSHTLKLSRYTPPTEKNCPPPTREIAYGIGSSNCDFQNCTRHRSQPVSRICEVASTS